MAAGAPLIHEHLRSYDGLRPPLPDVPNLHNYAEWRSGDHRQGFAEADFVFEQSFTTQRAHQGYLEPHAVVVQVEPSENILIWSTAKQVYLTRANLAEWLGIDEEKIIFQVGAVGGDFGSKGTLMDLPLCYFLAKVSGRPAKMIMSYAEELSRRQPASRLGHHDQDRRQKDGRLWARELKAVFNGGAYAGIKGKQQRQPARLAPWQRLLRDSPFVHSVAVRLHQLHSRRHHARSRRSASQLRRRVAHGLHRGRARHRSV